MFIGHSGSDPSVVYLYRATKVGVSSIPCYAHMSAFKGVWVMYGKVRILHYCTYNMLENNNKRLHAFLPSKV